MKCAQILSDVSRHASGCLRLRIWREEAPRPAWATSRRRMFALECLRVQINKHSHTGPHVRLGVIIGSPVNFSAAKASGTGIQEWRKQGVSLMAMPSCGTRAVHGRCTRCPRRTNAAVALGLDSRIALGSGVPGNRFAYSNRLALPRPASERRTTKILVVRKPRYSTAARPRATRAARRAAVCLSL